MEERENLNMYCRNCGNMIPDGTKFCPSCGAAQGQRTPAVNGVPVQVKSVSFPEAVKRFFIHYADFSGRSRRSEYWWVVLFNCAVSSVLGYIIPDLSWIWSLAILIPSIAICVRRLHDIGKGGAWYLLILIPIVGYIILLVWFCKDSTPDNQWGPNPKF